MQSSAERRGKTLGHRREYRPPQPVGGAIYLGCTLLVAALMLFMMALTGPGMFAIGPVYFLFVICSLKAARNISEGASGGG